jgi:very-short-patch-repair endonuclease
MVGIEIDGHRFHSTQAACRYDRQRDRMLRRRGWQIERFTTEDVRRTPNSMVQHVRALLARAAEQRSLAS